MKQLTAQIASRYFGCKVRTEYGDLEMIGVANNFLSVYEPPYPFTPDSESSEYECMYSQCQLLLTPISKISGNHSHEIAQIITDATHTDWVNDIAKGDLIRNFADLLVNGNSSNDDYEDAIALKSGIIVKILNKLREWGYDCDNLISQGIAIDATTLSSETDK